VDIGVFVHNGANFSAPAFITSYSLDNEARTYRIDRQPLEIGYGVGTATVSVADWEAFFNLLTSSNESLPSLLLRKQFKEEEIAALILISDEFNKAHAAVAAARVLQAKAQSAQKQGGGSPEEKRQKVADLETAQRAMAEASKAEQQLLNRNLSSVRASAAALAQKALDGLLHDPNLGDAISKGGGDLLASAGKKDLDAVKQIQQSLISLNIAANPDGGSFQFTPLIVGPEPLVERLTPFEKGVVEKLNSTLLNRILFTGIVNSDWRENFVDGRIASSKDWRDIYRYSSDGTPMGWVRYQSDGKMEFTKDGQLILEKDSQGRCTRASGVKYELESAKQDSGERPAGSSPVKLRMILNGVGPR
jgi:hypothetical protein